MTKRYNVDIISLYCLSCYLFVFLNIVQMCLLTDAEIEEFLPLVSHSISLSLEIKSNVMR